MKIPKRIKPLIEEGLVDAVLCQLMSGKEAMVYMVCCGEDICCAKVYKESYKQNFHQRAVYADGRKMKNSRRARAIAKGSRYGRREQEEAWQSTEVEMLCRLAAAGVRVPYFYNFFEGVLLMELIVDNKGDIAPRLNDVALTGGQACEYYHLLIRQVVRMLCAGIVHGDLSKYNILLSGKGPVLMDFSQAVDATSNNNACSLLKRDIDNLTAYFSRFAPELTDTDFSTEIWSHYKRGDLHPEIELTGCVKRKDKPVNVGNVLHIINNVLRKQVAWQRYKRERWTSPYLQH